MAPLLECPGPRPGRTPPHSLKPGEVILTQGEGEYYNVPVIAEGEDLAANLKKMRVRGSGITFNLSHNILMNYEFFLRILKTWAP